MVDLANMETVEKECGALGGLFQAIVNDMKVNNKLVLLTFHWVSDGGETHVLPP